jgi:dolichol-phosphate mannosyltransferase
MNESLKISVVLSFFNEEDVLEELVVRLRKVFRETLAGVVRDYELIFVNDASTDRSLEILLGLSKRNRDMKIINMSRNFGVSPCVLAGMQYASGDAVIYMDADLQDPPEMIIRMVDGWLTGKVDVVHMRRISRAGESRFKMFVTRLGYRILRRFSNIDLQPEVGDFKLLSRRTVNEMTRLKEKKPFTRGLARWIGFRQITMDYHREERFAGKTKFPVTHRKVIGNFLDSALISFSDIPLKIPLILGLFISFGAVASLIVMFVMKFSGWSLPGWPVVAAIVLVIGGIQLFAMGIVGLYIHAIYLETKNRPNFIIESTHGFENGRIINSP